MKSIKLSVLLLASCAITLCSCDSNKGKVKELAEQFITAYNDGDKAAIYDLFPTVKSYENLSINGTIGAGDDVSIEKNDSTGNYIATINEQRKQQLVYAVDSTGTIQLVDAYNVFRLDSVSNEIALKAGVPVKQLSDIEVGKLMDPQSDFISDLKNMKETNFLWPKYGAYSWSHSGTDYSVSMPFTIRNSSSQTISGKDYYIIVSPSQRSTGHTFPTKTIDGVDLAPDEVREFVAIEPSLYRYASERDLAYGVDVKYRTESIMKFLLNYCQFDGKEYQDFMKHPYRARLKSDGVSGMVSSEKNGFAYTYKEMSDKSEILDTLYHRKGIKLIWENEAWASVFHFDKHFDDIFIGYMKAEDIEISPDGLGLYLAVITLKSDNGKVNVCDDNGKVIKTIPVGQKAIMAPTEDGDPFLYERLPNGSVKKIGRISSENINWEEEWSPL